jgi:hypothetical protein
MAYGKRKRKRKRRIVMSKPKKNFKAYASLCTDDSTYSDVELDIEAEDQEAALRIAQGIEPRCEKISWDITIEEDRVKKKYSTTKDG